MSRRSISRLASRYTEIKAQDELYLNDLDDDIEIIDDDLTDDEINFAMEGRFSDDSYADQDFTYKSADDLDLDDDQDFIYRRAFSGMYGHTKATEKAVMSAVAKVTKKAASLASELERKEPVVGTYLATHANVSKCSSSMILSGQCMINEMPKRAGRGHLGHNPRVAKRALMASMSLRLFAGEVANDLSQKVKKAHDFLAEHSETEGCMASQLLIESMPVQAEDTI
jgi:hypothetical protein